MASIVSSADSISKKLLMELRRSLGSVGIVEVCERTHETDLSRPADSAPSSGLYNDEEGNGQKEKRSIEF